MALSYIYWLQYLYRVTQLLPPPAQRWANVCDVDPALSQLFWTSIWSAHVGDKISVILQVGISRRASEQATGSMN